MPSGYNDTAVLPITLNGRSYQVDLQMYERSLLAAQRASVDQGSTPGEQSINPEGSWPRSQTDWSFGGMQETRDDEDANPRRFYRQANTQAVRRGRIQLSNRLQVMSTTRGGALFVPVLPWNERLVVQTGNSVFWWEFVSPNYTLYRQTITAGPYGGAITPALAIAATATAMQTLATDGTNTTWMARGGSGVSRATTETGAFTVAWSVVGTNVIAYANGHLLGIAGASVWEFDSAGAKVGGANIFDHPNLSWVWQGAAAGAGRIYLWGAAGNDAAVYVLYDVLSSSGTLAPPKIALPLPPGESCQHMEAVGGVFLMRTNLGVRLVIPNGDALDMGGLITHRDLATDFPSLPTCVSAAAGDTVMVGWRSPLAQPDFIARVDLTRFVAENTPVMHPCEYQGPDATPTNNGVGPIKVVNRADTQFQSGQLWVWGGNSANTTRRIWAVTLGATPNSDLGSREKVPSGTFDVGWLTFNTSDPKQPVSLRVIHDPIVSGATIDVHLITETGAAIFLVTCNTGTATDFTVNPATIAPSRQFRLRFTLNRGTDPTVTPSVASWTSRAYIQPARQEEIILPIMLQSRVTATGRGPTVMQDVLFEYKALLQLAKDGTAVTLVEGGVSTTVRVDDVKLADQGHYRDYEGRTWSSPSVGTATLPPQVPRFIEGIYHVRCVSVV